MTNEPLQPDEIARREFEVVRRGFDQHAVRGFLQQISSQHSRQMAVEEDLRERVRAAEAKAAATEHPDEATMLSLLGEETTRVLTSAREAAADIRAKAEQAAERIIAEATAQAAQTRSGVVAEADKRLAEAKAEGDRILAEAREVLQQRTKEASDAAQRITAEATRQAELVRDEAQRALTAAQEQATAIVEAAKEEGKGMVAEAQAVRERVLKDLSAKRRKARAQLEQLNAGRERLLEAYEVVKGTVDAATRELSASVTDARLAASAAARRVAIEPDPSFEQLDEELVALHQAELPITLVKIPKGRQEREQRAAAGAAAPSAPAEAPPVEATPAEEPVAEAPVAEALPPAAPSVTDRVPPSASDFDPMPVPPELLRSRSEPPAAPQPAPAPEAEAEVEADAPESPSETEPVAEEPVAEPEPTPEPEPAPEPELAAEPEPEPEPTVEAVAEPEPAVEEPVAAVVEPAPEPEPASEPEPEPANGKAAAVFARLHALADEPAAVEPAREAAPAEDEPEPEPGTPTAFDARAAALGPVEKDLSKRLKRALADEQNEVLDQLRRGKPTGVDDLLPAADDHVARWATASAEHLAGAAAAGAGTSGGSAPSTVDLAEELARNLVLPLRERIERSFAASDGNLDDVSDRVRALYREWKNQRLPETAPHFVAAAYARGVFEAAPASARVQWVPDPERGACPDCDDNVLAGTIAKGDEFPTGDRCAPAHPGCRCLVLVATA